MKFGVACVASAQISAMAVIAFLILQPAPPPAALGPGRTLYVQHCASCHGTNLEGQPNWRERDANGYLPAPPHDATGHTWHHSDQQLLQIVRDGLDSFAPGNKTAMPEFGAVLTDPEIQSILDYFKSVWPERERDLQAARSKSELEIPAQ